VVPLALTGTLYYIGESKDEGAKPGFDLPGFLLITFGLGAFVFGLIEGRNYGWWEPAAPFSILGWTWPLESVSIIPFALGFGLVAMGIFAAVEVSRMRAGKFYLFDFTLWGFRTFRYGNLAGTIVSLGEFGLLFALPLFLQAVLGYSAFETGLVFLALAIGAFFAAPGAANLARRFGPRWVVTTGMVLEAVGIVAATLLISDSVTGLQLALPLFVYGLGVGFATAQLTSIVLSDVPVVRSGLASGANSTLRQVGSALGIAVLGTVLFTSLVNLSSSNIAAAFPDMQPACVDLVTTLVNESAGQVLPVLEDPSRVSGDGAFASLPSSLPPDQRACFGDPAFRAALPAIAAPIEEAFVSATRLTGITAAAFVTLGVVFSLLLPRAHPGPRTSEEELSSAVEEAIEVGAL
jgi:MFS family permease